MPRSPALAGQIVAKSPLTLAIGKEAFYRQAEMGLDDAYAYASEVMTRNMLARDAAEGIDAFLAKRPPVWSGHLILSRPRSLITASPMKDPYEILGVQKTDSDAAIRSAYRKLAKRHHPDVNPGKPEAAERFKEISAAYDLLGDKEKRARYDRGEIDAAGNEVPPQRPFYRDFGDARRARQIPPSVGFNHEDLEGIFAQAFGGRGGVGWRTAVLDARPGRPVPADARLPRCGERHHPPRHAARRAHAGCAHPGRRARMGR